MADNSSSYSEEEMRLCKYNCSQGDRRDYTGHHSVGHTRAEQKPLLDHALLEGHLCSSTLVYSSTINF